MKCPECQSTNLLFLPSEHEECCVMHTHYGTCLNCSAKLEMRHTKDKDPVYACLERVLQNKNSRQKHPKIK